MKLAQTCAKQFLATMTAEAASLYFVAGTDAVNVYCGRIRVMDNREVVMQAITQKKFFLSKLRRA